MDLDKLVDSVKQEVGKVETLCTWELKTASKNESGSFSFHSSYEVKKVIKKDDKIRVMVDVELFDDDSWHRFQHTAPKIFSSIITKQLADQVNETEDVLDIVVEGGDVL